MWTRWGSSGALALLLAGSLSWAQAPTYQTPPTVNVGTSAALALALNDETGSGVAVFDTSPVFTTNIDLGTAGVRLSDDGDGAVTLLGLGNGSDEDLTLNLDDTSDTAVWSSSTGVATVVLSGMAVLALRSVEANTGAKSPAATESREVYTNTGDGDGSSIALPNDPTVGTEYSVAVTVAQTITITPPAGETLRLAGSACGTSITSNVIGSYITITAVTGGNGAVYMAHDATGTWVCNA